MVSDIVEEVIPPPEPLKEDTPAVKEETVPEVAWTRIVSAPPPGLEEKDVDTQYVKIPPRDVPSSPPGEARTGPEIEETGKSTRTERPIVASKKLPETAKVPAYVKEPALRDEAEEVQADILEYPLSLEVAEEGPKVPRVSVPVVPDVPVAEEHVVTVSLAEEAELEDLLEYPLSVEAAEEPEPLKPEMPEILKPGATMAGGGVEILKPEPALTKTPTTEEAELEDMLEYPLSLEVAGETPREPPVTAEELEALALDDSPLLASMADELAEDILEFTLSLDADEGAVGPLAGVEEILYPVAGFNEYFYNLLEVSAAGMSDVDFQESPVWVVKAAPGEEPEFFGVDKAPSLSPPAPPADDLAEDILEFPLSLESEEEVLAVEDMLEFTLSEGAEGDDRAEKPVVAVIITDEQSMEAEILSPEENRMPSMGEYFQSLDEKVKGLEVEKTGALGILADIRVEFYLKGPLGGEVLPQLSKRTHPMTGARHRGKPEGVNLFEETEKVDIEGESGVKKVFSVARAEIGIYTLSIENTWEEPLEARVVFILYDGSEESRTREQRLELSPGQSLRFKFVLPEAVFWDDEDYFTGMVEGSDTVTKFNDETGFVWEEEKDY